MLSKRNNLLIRPPLFVAITGTFCDNMVFGKIKEFGEIVWMDKRCQVFNGF